MKRSGVLAILISLMAACLLSGCATTYNEDSDLPWNMPESWEGSPFIPGLNEGL